jgi:hypothetical protein
MFVCTRRFVSSAKGSVPPYSASRRTEATQTIISLSESEKMRRIRVISLHFNASGEGKRSETDGHTTYIKSCREAAMRAGEPAACVTMDPKAHTKLLVTIQGVSCSPGFQSWKVEKIQSFHDVKLHKNGDVTAWKSS